MAGETETGYKWWLRYVIVPILGSGGVIAIIVALLSRPSTSPLPTLVAIATTTTPTVTSIPLTNAPGPTRTLTLTRTPVAPIQVLFDEAHNEWPSIVSSFQAFADDLRLQGYSVSRHTNGPLTSELLINFNILVIGTAWGDFTTAELDAIQQFVSNGGGLFITGVGWSWVSSDQGRTLDNFPMNRVSVLFGLRFLEDTICDPTNQSPGGNICTPLFSTTAVHPITSGLTTIGGPVSPCPLERLNGAPQEIIFGDSDAYSNGGHYPAGTNPPVMMAIEYGAGRVVALGHEGYLTTDDYDEDGNPNRDDYDNVQLGRNIIDWLAVGATKF